MIKQRLTDAQVATCCLALNSFGNGMNPDANAHTYSFFKKDYLRECLLRMAASDYLNESGQRAAKLMIHILDMGSENEEVRCA